MTPTIIYDPDLNKASVFEADYKVADYNFNSSEFNTEIKISESKADEYLELMEAEKLEHEYFVKMN